MSILQLKGNTSGIFKYRGYYDMLSMLRVKGNFTRASSATLWSSTALTIVGINVARFDTYPLTGAYRGLLVEETRTNSITNSTMVGALVDPSTLPNNWAVESVIGLATTVVNIGSENGLDYIDINIAGTSTGTAYQIRCDFGVPSVLNDTWTGSAYVKKVGGTTTNISNGNIITRELGGSYSGIASDNFDMVTTDLTRYTATKTMTDAGNLNAQWITKLTVTNGTAIDITLRIASPQLEKGSSLTSYIPSAGASVARSADIPNIPISDFFNHLKGTLYIEFERPFQGADSQPVFIGDGTANNFLRVFLDSAGTTVSVACTSSGVLQTTGLSTSVVAGSKIKLAFTYRENRFAISVNGAATITDNSGLLPVGLNNISIGHAGAFGFFLNGFITQLHYHPTEKTDSELESLTA